MNRRAFFRTVGSGAAAAAVVSSDVFGRSATNDKLLATPQSIIGLANRDRLKITSTLTPWVPSVSQEWDVTTINHLYRRAGFGATLSEIAAAKSKTPGAVVDALLDNNLLSGANLPAAPRYSDQWLGKAPYLGSDYTQQQTQQSAYYSANMEIRRQWTVLMNAPKTMLREKMSLFWMNHFALEENKVYYPQSMYSYLDYFRKNTWGNFKQMVKDVSISPAMLIYLDGQLNAGTAPNENYGRELMELFTLGPVDKDGNPNYTEADIRAVSHSLTGWIVDARALAPNVLPAIYVTSRHDSSFQKIFDDTKRQYNLASSGATLDKDIIDHIFDSRGDQLAWFICAKLYQYLVYHDINGASERAIIGAMATTFKSNNWEIKPVLAELLKSEHFFDAANIGAQLKSPYDHIVSMSRSVEITLSELSCGSLYYYTAAQAQILLNPPNVKGWPGYHSWISTTTLPYRNIMATQLVVSKSLPAYGSDGYGNSHTAVTLSDAEVLAWGKQFTNYKGAFDSMLAEMASFLCAQVPGPKALAYVKSKLPANTYEWNTLDDSSKIGPLRLMAKEIMLLAEYQLY